VWCEGSLSHGELHTWDRLRLSAWRVNGDEGEGTAFTSNLARRLPAHGVAERVSNHVEIAGVRGQLRQTAALGLCPEKLGLIPDEVPTVHFEVDPRLVVKLTRMRCVRTE